MFFLLVFISKEQLFTPSLFLECCRILFLCPAIPILTLVLINLGIPLLTLLLKVSQGIFFCQRQIGVLFALYCAVTLPPVFFSTEAKTDFFMLRQKLNIMYVVLTSLFVAPGIHCAVCWSEDDRFIVHLAVFVVSACCSWSFISGVYTVQFRWLSYPSST